MSVVRFRNIILRISTGRLVHVDFSGRGHGYAWSCWQASPPSVSHLVNASKFLFIQKRLRVHVRKLLLQIDFVSFGCK